MTARSPAEVSFYLGLATATATFSAAAVALGLLQCTRARERAGAVAVLLCGTLGIAAALATVARGKTSGAGNILIGVGVTVAAACVLWQSLRLIFTIREPSRPLKQHADRSTSTQQLAVTWTAHWTDAQGTAKASGAGSPVLIDGPPMTGVLRGPLWGTFVAVGAVVALAAVIAVPDLFEGFLQSRPVGRALARHNVECEPTEFCLARFHNMAGGLYQSAVNDSNLADDTFYYYGDPAKNEQLPRVGSHTWSAWNRGRRDVIVYDRPASTGAGACIRPGPQINLPAEWKDRIASFRLATRSVCNRYEELADANG